MSVSCTPLGTVTTGNLGLCKPQIGETGWGTAWNANLDAIDAQITQNTADILAAKMLAFLTGV